MLHSFHPKHSARQTQTSAARGSLGAMLNKHLVMNKTTLIFFILFFSSFSLFSQNLKFELKFPEPRRGDEIILSVFLEEGGLATKPIDGDFKLRHYTQDTGSVSIGPISLTVNGRNYTTDSIKVRIIEKLPNVDSGVWIRVVKFNNVEYLIMEERISYQRAKGSPVFIGLSEYLINETGLKISMKSSSSYTQKIKDKYDEDKSVHYKISVFDIKKEDSLKGDFKIGRQYFRDVEEGINVPEVVIKK